MKLKRHLWRANGCRGISLLYGSKETGERIPLTIVGSDIERGTITLIVQAIGKTTRALAMKKVGDSITDVAGPLGTPTPIEYHGAVACVGGGVGTAELYPISQALHTAGNHDPYDHRRSLERSHCSRKRNGRVFKRSIHYNR